MSTDDAALAAELVQLAGTLAAEMLDEGLRTTHKTSISDVVSAADHEAERLIVERLALDRPEDGFLGEEGARRAGARIWCVDPVDGTYNFLNGLPTWCSAVALIEDGADIPLLGAIYQPRTGELWVGGVELPTRCNGDALPPLRDAPLAQLSVSTYLHPTTLPDAGAREPLLRVMSGAATVRMLGSGSVELAAIAAGRLGVWAQVDSLPWDWLPGAALVRAVGGRTAVFEAHGHRWHVAGPPTAVAQTLELIGVS